MTELRWTRDTTFVDVERGDRYRGSGVYDVPDDRVEAYLGRGWERVDSEGEHDEEDGEVLEPTRSDEELSEILDGTVGDVESAVGGIDEQADLERLRDLEVEGDKRTTALDAIDGRLEELTQE